MGWPAADDREQCQVEITDTLERPVKCSLIGEQAGVIWYGKVGQIFAYNPLSPNMRPIKITQTYIDNKNNISNSLEFHVSFVMKNRKTIVSAHPSACIQHASAPVALDHAEIQIDQPLVSICSQYTPGRTFQGTRRQYSSQLAPYFLWQRRSSRVARSVSRMVRKTT